ncbi:hypothetical protein RPMD05_33 [Rhodobacteraceae phage LS06-2018-MD05]|nr:hypothetical protein RPMD05_33 [Rhodobacteraceae phage LS06-2018-MD05]
MKEIELPNFFNKGNPSEIPKGLRKYKDINELDKYKFIKDGEYFWAFLFSSDDMCVFVKEDGYYYMAGAWDGSFNSQEFAFIEIINKPNKKLKL